MGLSLSVTSGSTFSAPCLMESSVYTSDSDVVIVIVGHSTETALCFCAYLFAHVCKPTACGSAAASVLSAHVLFSRSGRTVELVKREERSGREDLGCLPVAEMNNILFSLVWDISDPTLWNWKQVLRSEFWCGLSAPEHVFQHGWTEGF